MNSEKLVHSRDFIVLVVTNEVSYGVRDSKTRQIIVHSVNRIDYDENYIYFKHYNDTVGFFDRSHVVGYVEYKEEA